MAILAGQVATNSSTATLIVAAENANTVYVGRGTSPRSVQLLNVDGSNDIYLGPLGVTTGNGYKLAHGQSISLTIAEGDAIYGISNTSTPSIHYVIGGG